MNKLISVIIPVYNEEQDISACLKSLKSQFYKNIEIIVVDDGSTDKTKEILKKLQRANYKLQIIHQNHKGPGSARNLGASKASGEILVFVDADMTFDKYFIEKLVSPIISGKAIGTFSRDEFVSNKNNIWSICWNINRNLPKERMIPKNYPNTAPVYRAILKKEFDRVGGFETTGQYTDDWSLSQKLDIKSQAAPNALYYHANPSSLKEIWHQARWIGKNDFISGNTLRILKSFIIYNPISSIIIGFVKSLIYQNIHFLIFKIIYDAAILTSLFKSFASEPQAK